MKTKVINFSEIKPGDQIIGSDGNAKLVTNVYDEHLPKDMYELDFGEFTIKASGNHLWYCETNQDADEKEYYINLALNYFATEPMPSLEDTAYPIEIIKEKFATTEMSREFIERVCESMGHSVETPEVFFDNYMDLVGEKLIKRYSTVHLYEFLENMRTYITEGKGYFYFGKVRTTDEIFELKRYNNDVNIPRKEDMING